MTTNTKPMTAQQIFDGAAGHLLTQRARSLQASGNCAYRGTEGRMCAVGALIPNEVYQPGMENLCIVKLMTKSDFAEDLTKLFGQENMKLLDSIQGCHDGTPVGEWHQELSEIAKRFQLNRSVLGESDDSGDDENGSWG